MKLLDLLKGYRCGRYVWRLLTAFVLTVSLFAVLNGTAFSNIKFYSGVNLPLFVCFLLVLFAFLCLIASERIITVTFLIGMGVYFVHAASQANDYMFSIGLCAVLCAAVWFADTDSLAIRPGRCVTWGAVICLMLAFAAFVGGICVVRYLNCVTPCYDFGIFSQMFYYMKETGQMLTTCERDGLLNHLAVHFSPIYYLLLPAYMLIPSPATLLVGQAVIVASGILPLVLICRHYRLSNTATVVFSLCYALYPAFWGGCLYYLHENCFLAPLVLWLLYFLEKEKAAPALISALLTLAVKEDAAVYVAVIALYFLFSGKKRATPAVILCISVVYFILVTSLMTYFGEGVMSSSRYGDYIYDDGGLFTVIKAVIQNPVYVLYQVFREEKLLFILQMLMPVCFLPLAVKKPEKLILFIPFVLVNLMTGYSLQYNIGFQYAFGSGSMLFYLAVSNYSGLGIKRGKSLVCAALASVIIFAGGYFSETRYAVHYNAYESERAVIAEAMALIPDDASVISSAFFVANLSQREEIYHIEYTDETADYVIFDIRYGSGDVSLEEYTENSDYTMIYYKEGVVALFERN